MDDAGIAPVRRELRNAEFLADFRRHRRHHRLVLAVRHKNLQPKLHITVNRIDNVLDIEGRDFVPGHRQDQAALYGLIEFLEFRDIKHGGTPFIFL